MRSNNDINNSLFRQAVEAIDAGDLSLLDSLLNAHLSLVTDPLDHPSGDYFDHPYLLWFVADNPIRHQQLPANITSITERIIATLKQQTVPNLQHQLDYTLGLVAIVLRFQISSYLPVAIVTQSYPSPCFKPTPSLRYFRVMIGLLEGYPWV